MLENKGVISRKNTGNTQYALISGNLHYPLGEEITAVTMLLPGLPWDVQGHAHPQLPVTCISIADCA
jgi:hypothetical protein